jgi:hypothetical protein
MLGSHIYAKTYSALLRLPSQADRPKIADLSVTYTYHQISFGFVVVAPMLFLMLFFLIFGWRKSHNVLEVVILKKLLKSNPFFGINTKHLTQHTSAADGDAIVMFLFENILNVARRVDIHVHYFNDIFVCLDAKLVVESFELLIANKPDHSFERVLYASFNNLLTCNHSNNSYA